MASTVDRIPVIITNQSAFIIAFWVFDMMVLHLFYVTYYMTENQVINLSKTKHIQLLINCIPSVAGKMAQQVKELFANTDNLSLILTPTCMRRKSIVIFYLCFDILLIF